MGADEVGTLKGLTERRAILDRIIGGRVRITGQLIEAATDRHLWADKFDGALDDVFGLQDQVTSSVVGLIAPKLEQAEIERARTKPAGSLDSYDLFLRGMALAYRRGRQSEAREFFSKAFELDPNYGAAYAMAPSTLMWQQGITGLPLTVEMRTDAIRLARLGSKVGSDDAVALARSGHVLVYIGREYDQGASLVEQAVVLNPNLALAWYSREWVALMCGEAERAIESFARMIRLSPLDRLKASVTFSGKRAAIIAETQPPWQSPTRFTRPQRSSTLRQARQGNCRFPDPSCRPSPIFNR